MVASSLPLPTHPESYNTVCPDRMKVVVVAYRNIGRQRSQSEDTEQARMFGTRHHGKSSRHGSTATNTVYRRHRTKSQNTRTPAHTQLLHHLPAF
jgi:hypothetical protein